MSVETPEYLAAAARFLRAAGRRIAESGDDVDLAAFLALREVFDEAVQTGVDGMRARECSWDYIGRGAGIKRSAAQERWGASNREKRSA
jgi:hypothetical protein